MASVLKNVLYSIDQAFGQEKKKTLPNMSRIQKMLVTEYIF